MGLVIKETQPDEQYDPIDGNSHLKEGFQRVIGKHLVSPTQPPRSVLGRSQGINQSAEYGLSHAFTSSFDEIYADLEKVYNSPEGLEELPIVE